MSRYKQPISARPIPLTLQLRRARRRRSSSAVSGRRVYPHRKLSGAELPPPCRLAGGTTGGFSTCFRLIRGCLGTQRNLRARLQMTRCGTMSELGRGWVCSIPTENRACVLHKLRGGSCLQYSWTVSKCRAADSNLMSVSAMVHFCWSH